MNVSKFKMFQEEKSVSDSEDSPERSEAEDDFY